MHSDLLALWDDSTAEPARFTSGTDTGATFCRVPTPTWLAEMTGLSLEPETRIIRYLPGEGLDWHTDRGHGAPHRRKTVIVALNDDYEGGELELLDAEPFTLPVGVPFVLDAGTHHRVHPVTAGVRYTAVAWSV